MRPTVYIETTIPSYLTARPSRNLIRAAEQQLTRDWWAVRHEYDLRVSQLVLDECGCGDATAAAERLAALDGVPMLDQPVAVDRLGTAILRVVAIPLTAAPDAFHIAAAAVHGIEYLLTWNCRHLNNPMLRPRIDAVCRGMGFETPVICTPRELLGRNYHEDES